MKHTLVPISSLLKDGYQVSFHPRKGCIMRRDGWTVLIPEANGVYPMHVHMREEVHTPARRTAFNVYDTIDGWHRRLCHVNFANIRAMERKGSVVRMRIQGPRNQSQHM